MTSVRVTAPAKINWSLEVLGRRNDGYHEVQTVLQAIDLCDIVVLDPGPDVSLELLGEVGPLAEEPPESNLAMRAAIALRESRRSAAGARIRIEKRIPVAAGLGGGSSNAAATLLGLRVLWGIDASDEELAAIAADLGSDMPFFLRAGTALASGRGEKIKPLPDAPPQRIVVAWPEEREAANKTARMYAALHQEHYTDGAHGELVARAISEGRLLRDDDLFNAFESVLAAQPESARLFYAVAQLGLRPHLAGSGPAFFLLLPTGTPGRPIVEALEALGARAVETRTLSANDAPRIERDA